LADQPWRDQIASFCELYKVRRDAMLESLDEYFPATAQWTKPGGGFYVWVTLPPEIDTTALMPKAIVAKVAYVPGTAFMPMVLDHGRCVCRIATQHQNVSAKVSRHLVA
jgi:2-aminoadipate transaminase